MEYKTLAQCEFKTDDDQEGVVRGYAAVFGNVDSYGDIIDEGAFTKTLQERPHIPVLWQHFDVAGLTREAEENKRGLKVAGELNLHTNIGHDAWEFARQGAVTGLSIGYDTIKAEPDPKRSDIRRLKEIRLLEWSLVSFPANDRARITDVKTALDSAMCDLRMLLDVAEPTEHKPGWDETDESWRYRVRDPSKFIKGSFRTVSITTGVKAIMGKLKGGDGTMKVQSLIFDKDEFDLAAAKAWLKDHSDITKALDLDVLQPLIEPLHDGIEPETLHSIWEIVRDFNARVGA